MMNKIIGHLLYSPPEILLVGFIALFAIIVCFLGERVANMVVPRFALLATAIIVTILAFYGHSNYARLFVMLYITAILLLFDFKHKSLSRIIVFCLAFSLLFSLSANHLLPLFLGLELYALSFCFFMFMDENVAQGGKYLVISSVMSAVFVYGASLCYLDFGTTSFNFFDSLKMSMLGEAGILLVISYLLFKLNAAPFHIWSISIYETTKSTHIVMMLDSLLKLTMFVVFANFCAVLLSSGILFFQKFLLVIAVASMVVGGIFPFVENNINRLIAYSSIGHVGFAMVVFSIANAPHDIKYSISYMFTYFISSMCFFSGFIGLKRHNAEIKLFSHLTQLGSAIKEFPIYVYSMLCGLLSMAGLPPFVNFFAKIDIFKKLVYSEKYWLVAVVIIYSLLVAAYTANAMKHAYMKSPVKLEISQAKGSIGNKFVCVVFITLSLFSSASFDKISSFIGCGVDLSINQINTEKQLSLDGIKDLYKIVKSEIISKSSFIEDIYEKLK